MSLKRGGAAAVTERRAEWVASLRSSLPQFVQRSAAPLERGHAAAILGTAPRRALDAAVTSTTAALLLPPQWRETASQRLAAALHGVVPPSHLQQTDYFHCSLIHPTYVHAGTVRRGAADAAGRRSQQELRRVVCMPLELSVAGANGLRLLREVNQLVKAGGAATVSAQLRARSAASGADSASAEGDSIGGSSGSSSRTKYELDAAWPQLTGVDAAAFADVLRSSGLASLVLYDKSFFASAATSVDGGDAVPDEVALAAITALCGSIELTSGWAAVLHFADRVARERRREAVEAAVR
ncbi:hypothetical protein NESM_000522800 [Novymonas esmeraldas]|uniref:Uncharacterized protein n=1 Tax=Novymonas esmeraldas TaxID=1808958 RepID=A0AAW0EQG8_9TRYP